MKTRGQNNQSIEMAALETDIILIIVALLLLDL